MHELQRAPAVPRKHAPERMLKNPSLAQCRSVNKLRDLAEGDAVAVGIGACGNAEAGCFFAHGADPSEFSERLRHSNKVQ